MGMTAPLEKILAYFAGKESTKETRVATLVADLANDKDRKPEDVEAVLKESGLSLAELVARVDVKKKRKAAADTVHRGRTAAREREAHHQRAAEAKAARDAAIEAANRKFEAIREPAASKVRECEQKEREAERAEAFLRETAPPERLAELQEAMERRQEIVGRLNGAVSDAGKANSEIADLNVKLSAQSLERDLVRGDHRAKLKQRLADLTAVEAEASSRAGSIKAELAAADQAIAELDSKLLEP